MTTSPVEFQVESPLLTADEAAHYLRISIRALHRLVRLRKLPCVSETRRDRRFFKTTLDAYIESINTPQTLQSLDIPSKSPLSLASRCLTDLPSLIDWTNRTASL